ncbi:hypothetical protein VTK26DRAFT_332 [Humicola hyalothermophila]
MVQTAGGWNSVSDYAGMSFRGARDRASIGSLSSLAALSTVGSATGNQAVTPDHSTRRAKGLARNISYQAEPSNPSCPRCELGKSWVTQRSETLLSRHSTLHMMIDCRAWSSTLAKEGFARWAIRMLVVWMFGCPSAIPGGDKGNILCSSFSDSEISNRMSLASRQTQIFIFSFPFSDILQRLCAARILVRDIVNIAFCRHFVRIALRQKSGPGRRSQGV